MASKYQSSVASSDNSVFRCSVPTGDLAVQPNYRLKLTPYAYMYLNVKYGTQSPIQLRAEPNKVYEIPFEGEKADIVDVDSLSCGVCTEILVGSEVIMDEVLLVGVLQAYVVFNLLLLLFVYRNETLHQSLDVPPVMFCFCKCRDLSCRETVECVPVRCIVSQAAHLDRNCHGVMDA